MFRKYIIILSITTAGLRLTNSMFYNSHDSGWQQVGMSGCRT